MAVDNACLRLLEQAHQEADELGHGWLGTEHVLLALLRDRGSLPARVLARFGMTHENARQAVSVLLGPCTAPFRRPLDAEALAAIGIDLAVVRESVADEFGEGALERTCAWRRAQSRPMTPRAKKLYWIAVRESLRMRERRVYPHHLLLALAREGEGVAAHILRHEVGSVSVLRTAVAQELRRSA